MENDLVEDWKRISLVEAEDKVVNFEPNQEGDVKSQVSLCLVGKLNTKNSFNHEALKQIMRNIWGPSQGLVITDLNQNLFAFQFFSLGNKDFVLEEGPSAIDGHILLLKELDANVQPSKIDFNVGRLWVTIYGLPMGMRNLKGLMLELRGAPTGFKIKYVKLPDFCYAYSFSGHKFTWWNCQEDDDSVEETLDQFCASSKGSAMFPEAKVTYLDDDFSDHLSILLRVFESHHHQKKARRRCFENLWALDTRCESIFRGAWQHGTEANPIHRCMESCDATWRI
ncbi:hypothetical protein Cgig2_023549 [Carnegiea gigantea]|uniref:DUF4283 domain-containing protein n=1 Tax=Carnegiea gigantea TaxID=171969 RepID=A0A9Q1JYT0_9CARY|nr:hypothetical protein Cgig2_023549 [Carnegiea gigantea]